MEDISYMDSRTISMIKKTIRMTFLRYSPVYQEALQEALSMQKGPMGGNRFHCRSCGDIFALKDIEVDHIVCVAEKAARVKLNSLEGYYKAIWCDVSNLQVLCKSCHAIKTLEDKDRMKAAKKALRVKKVKKSEK